MDLQFWTNLKLIYNFWLKLRIDIRFSILGVGCDVDARVEVQLMHLAHDVLQVYSRSYGDKKRRGRENCAWKLEVGQN